MNRQQVIFLLSGVALFFILYFGCDVKTKEQKAIAQSRAINAEMVDMAAHKDEALAALNAADKARMGELMQKAASKSPEDLKNLSSAWHDLQHDDIAAWYAEQVAEIEKTDDAWSIAGANYYIAINQNTDETMRNFCAQRAASAFQNAISINPDKIEHRINLALCYTEQPPKDNPMKGILMLRELDEKNPENIAVNLQLARLAIKTGQFGRAIERLEKIEGKAPTNARLICLLAEAYQGENNPKAAQAMQKCSQLKGGNAE